MSYDNKITAPEAIRRSVDSLANYTDKALDKTLGYKGTVAGRDFGLIENILNARGVIR
jgi:hypothetical protein